MADVERKRLRFDWKIVVITVASTLLLLLSYYRRFTSSRGLDQTILFFFIPLGIIILLFREHPRQYGLTLGDWKAGLVITLGSMLLIAPVLWLATTAHGTRDWPVIGWSRRRRNCGAACRWVKS